MKKITKFEGLPEEVLQAFDETPVIRPKHIATLAYNAGLRDGAKREPLTHWSQVPKACADAFGGLYSDFDRRRIMQVINAFIAGEQPAETPVPQAEQIEIRGGNFMQHREGNKVILTRRSAEIAGDTPAETPAPQPTAEREGNDVDFESLVQVDPPFSDAERECHNGLCVEAIFSLIDELRKRGGK